ncbi:MAG: hypothetical protein LUC92_04910 [Clostridiales bacterium]|nr:hypothetical protein [Clostridiales bacterium]
MEQNGFAVDYAALFLRLSIQKTERGFVDWIEMFIKEPFQSMDAELKQKIYKEIEDNARPKLYTKDGWVIDYTMLRVRARAV